MRKPSWFLFAALIAVSFATPARSSVILSELCDPNANYSTDRLIEIYNTGPDVVDLTGWRLTAVKNATTTVDTTTWNLSGILAAGQAKVAGSDSTVAVFTVDFQNAQWRTPAGYMNWNGKVGDGARLWHGNTVIDEMIAPGTLFENADLVRVASVVDPSVGYVANQWTSTPVQLATNASPGTHNGSVPPPPGPSITNIVTDPTAPNAGDAVDVEATVVSTSGAITVVRLSWGTTSGSQPNTIGMPQLSGDVYRTSAQIPAQAGGTTIYYRVQADTDSSSSLSSVCNYVLSGGGGNGPPTVLAVGEMSDSTLLVFFSEPVEEASAEFPSYYTVGALTAVDAVRDPVQPSQVLLTVRNIPPGTRTLTVNGVADLEANVASGATRSFNYVDVTIPAGYYNGAIGLTGSALRVALHNIIKNHTHRSYDYAFTAFETSGVKPNGKVYGNVGTATTTSWNGSKLGSSVSPGYGGTVFEPIGPFKGDLARSQFYVATRYFNEDSGWPGSPSASGSQLVPWAADQYLAWSNGDPVSWKERMRNGAIWLIQNNRNPFVDHPEFVAMIYDTSSVAGVGDTPGRALRLRQNSPNPFDAETSIGFDLARSDRVTLRIYDVAGRTVRTLVDGTMLESGQHRAEWDGRDGEGALVRIGLYFCRLDAGSASETRRMVFAR